MSLLKQIMSMTDNELFEDLGSLKTIERKFAPALKNSTKMLVNKQKIRDARITGDELKDYEKRWKAPELPATIGEKSPITKGTAKNSAEFLRILDDPNTACILLTHGSRQLGIFVKNFVEIKYRTEKSFAVGLDLVELSHVNDTFKTLIDADLKNKTTPHRISGGVLSQQEKYGSAVLYKLGFGNTVTVINNTTPQNLKEVTKIVDKLFAYYKASKMTMEFDIYGVDTERVNLHKNRVNARAKLEPLSNSSDYKAYITQIKSDFKLRLDKYKSSKAIDVNELTDLIHVIIDKGYLDKIKVKGLTYDLSDDHISFRSLRGKDNYSNNNSYITYRINTDTPEYEKRMTEYKNKRNEYHSAAAARNEKDLNSEEEKHLTEMKIPRGFKIILTLQGGTIVPHDVEIEQGYW